MGNGIKVDSVFVFFKSNFLCTDTLLIRITFYSKVLKKFSKYHAIAA